MSGVVPWLGVAVLGAVGAWARFRVADLVTARTRGDFPAGTFVVNLTGGFALGVLVGASVGGDALFVAGTGLLGGYTTFSTWMLEAERLGEDGAFGLAALYLLGSMLAGLAATGLGWVLAEAIA